MAMGMSYSGPIGYRIYFFFTYRWSYGVRGVIRFQRREFRDCTEISTAHAETPHHDLSAATAQTAKIIYLIHVT